MKFRMGPVFASLLLSDCGGGFVAAGPSVDVGTVGVSGPGRGIGGALEAGVDLLHSPTTVWSIIHNAAVAGYSSSGDGDPVFLSSIELRYRRILSTRGTGVRPLVEAGAGPAMVMVAGPRAGGLLGHFAVGVEQAGKPIGWTLTARVRPVGLIGRQAEFFGSAQLMFGMTWSRQR